MISVLLLILLERSPASQNDTHLASLVCFSEFRDDDPLVYSPHRRDVTTLLVSSHKLSESLRMIEYSGVQNRTTVDSVARISLYLFWDAHIAIKVNHSVREEFV
jgi:hypothetical protein